MLMTAVVLGQPVLFQHGLCGDARQPAEVFPQQTGFRRITLECRGHGASEPGDHSVFSISTFADDAIAMIEQLELAPLIVGGISMGAAIALRIAVTRPDLVRGLVIARPAWSTAAAPRNMAAQCRSGRIARPAFARGCAARHFWPAPRPSALQSKRPTILLR